MLLEHVLRHYLPRLYHGFEILSAHAIRVTRDAEFGLVRRRDEDLLMSIEQGIRERRMGDAVRLQYDPDLPKELLTQLVEELELSGEDLYPGKGFTAFTDLFQLYAHGAYSSIERSRSVADQGSIYSIAGSISGIRFAAAI